MNRFLTIMRWPGWRELFARLALPMLALAASWGVYSFALWFVPQWVAIVTAGAFELVYIGLALAQLDDAQRKRAKLIAWGAVAVSMSYNTIDGLRHLRPALFDGKPLWADIALALLHGVPLALLAYALSDLLMHAGPPTSAQPDLSKSRDLSKSPAITDSAATINLETSSRQSSPGRPSVATLDDLMKVIGDRDECTRSELIDLVDASASAIDRLLADGVEAGRLERIGRGIYQRKSG